MTRDIKKTINGYVQITIASVFYGMGVSLFLDPNNISSGGITGVAMILSRIMPLKTGTLYFLINIPILAAGTWKFGFRFLVKTIYAVFATSVFVNFFAAYGALSDDILVNAMAGGILVALGVGLVFRTGAATGGVDVIAKLLRLRFRHLKAGFLMMVFDILVVAASGVLWHDMNRTMYALLSVFVCDRAIDFVVYGGNGAKLCYIITDHHKAIIERLMTELEVGCTLLKGQGAWTKKEKEVILVVVQKRMSPRVEQIVKEEDKLAFLIESYASEIYGEGYLDLNTPDVI
ncbi:MAG: YitT family protein [Lachnospiraceae bacterium]|nr:YitT family protein [Lachnospiraceae bacterium]